jgi:hypothetical protein
MPYTSCYWDTNASVKINKTIAKPGEKITISWSGANPGTANDIAGFSVEYSLNSGDWKAVKEVDKNTSSITMTVPNYRGKIISAQVTIKNTQDFTDPSKTGGSCRINQLPNKPTKLSTAKTIIPSTQSKVSFTMAPGSDEDGQTYSIVYATSLNGPKTGYTPGGELTITEPTTYYFWTWDGMEASSEYVY